MRPNRRFGGCRKRERTSRHDVTVARRPSVAIDGVRSSCGPPGPDAAKESPSGALLDLAIGLTEVSGAIWRAFSHWPSGELAVGRACDATPGDDRHRHDEPGFLRACTAAGARPAGSRKWHRLDGACGPRNDLVRGLRNGSLAVVGGLAVDCRS